ncbi:MAG: N(2)-acetyl-L-2,4-diaminobutanoate deacetylase DoeB [Gammaproteobacteria bacterium]
MQPTSMDLRSKISTQVDLSKQGAQHGHLTVPHSRNESPWGSLLVPISVFANGDGPTVLFIGGNHGDEYEGPIALLRMIRELQADQIKGRVIILPALNYPALKAGTRLSPVDGKNMNRAFPGSANGTVTEMVADYVYRYILPLCDAVVDIHAGGRMMSFLPTAVIHRLPDAQQMAHTVAAVKAFGAPNTLVLEELDAGGMLDTAVEDMGKIFISTELGGGGTTTRETVNIAVDGVRNVLKHFGMLPGEPEGETTRFLETPDGAFVIAESNGLFECHVNPGDSVSQGDILGTIHDIDAPTEEPKNYLTPMDGIVMHRHVAGQILRGDCLSVIAVPTEEFD